MYDQGVADAQAAQQPAAAPAAPAEDPIEQIEKLEMLRVLEQGYRIAVGVTEDSLIEIDTREQAAEFEAVVKEHYKPEA